MSVSINNTQVVFNDATTQTTAGVTSVGAGTGISSSGGLTPTITNTGVTSVSGAGTVSVSASSGAVTITGGGLTSAVTSVATGNGLSGGTITSTGTLTVACPTFNTVGSYCAAGIQHNGEVDFSVIAGNNYGAGTGNGQIYNCNLANQDGFAIYSNLAISGTWKWMGASQQIRYFYIFGFATAAIACRVS